MKIKTSDLVSSTLDWAVTYATYGEQAHYIYEHCHRRNAYSTDWAQGGPVIESEGIQLFVTEDRTDWLASCWAYPKQQYGPTPLIAAMRCYVASKLGDEVEVPGGLL